MSKRALLVMSFLFVFTFGGAISDFSLLNANPENKTEQTDKRKRNKKGTKKKTGKKNTKRSSGKKTSKKKSSGKKKYTGKKKYKGKKKSSKRYKGKKKGKKYSSRKRTSNYNTYRSSSTGTYTPPKTYDNSGSENSSREYKRSDDTPSNETFKKEPKKEGDN